MASWIFFVLAAQLIWAVCSLIDKFVISKGHIRNPLVYIVLNGLMNVFLVFLLPFFDIGPITAKEFFMALVSSASITGAIAAYYKAIQYDEISRIAVLYQFTPIFTLLIAFFALQDRLTGKDFIGFVLLILAGLIVSYHRKKRSFKIGKAFYYMILSGLLAGIAYATAKYVFNSMEFWNGVLWLKITDFVGLSVLLAPSIRKEFIQTFRRMPPKIKKLLLFKMAIDFSAFVISDAAILLGPVALVSALASASAPVFIFLLALITSLYMPRLVREEITKPAILTKLFAIALIITGIIFINL